MGLYLIFLFICFVFKWTLVWKTHNSVRSEVGEPVSMVMPCTDQREKEKTNKVTVQPAVSSELNQIMATQEKYWGPNKSQAWVWMAAVCAGCSATLVIIFPNDACNWTLVSSVWLQPICYILYFTCIILRVSSCGQPGAKQGWGGGAAIAWHIAHMQHNRLAVTIPVCLSVLMLCSRSVQIVRQIIEVVLYAK